MQEGKFEKAHTAFNHMLAASPADLAERIRMYINACLQQCAKSKTQFATRRGTIRLRRLPAERRQLRGRARPLKKIIAEDDKADYAFYGLAILASMTGEAHTLSRTPH
jgi:LPS O-antigen subunit length determinant protein (WzzB/FepE family)